MVAYGSLGLFFYIYTMPYFGDSPDGLVSDAYDIKVKCLYTNKYEQNVPEKHFSSLEFNADFYIQRPVRPENWIKPPVMWRVVVA